MHKLKDYISTAVQSIAAQKKNIYTETSINAVNMCKIIKDPESLHNKATTLLPTEKKKIPLSGSNL